MPAGTCVHPPFLTPSPLSWANVRPIFSLLAAVMREMDDVLGYGNSASDDVVDGVLS